MKLRVQFERVNDYRGIKGQIEAFVIQNGQRGANILAKRRVTTLESAKMEVRSKMYMHEVEFLPFDDPWKEPPKLPPLKTPRDNYGIKGVGPAPKRDAL